MAVAVQELLEVRARQAKIPTPAEIKAPDPLREAALHPRPQRILGFELRSSPGAAARPGAPHGGLAGGP